MKLKHLFCCGVALCVASTGAQAATFNLIDVGGVKGSKAEAGFNIAAAYWGSVLTNDVTINLNVQFAPLAPNVIGSTGSARTDVSVARWERGITATKSNSLLDRAIVLPTLNNQGGVKLVSNGTDADGNDDLSYTQFIDGTTTSSKTLYMNTALAKATGIVAGNSPVIDGNITFSSTFGFDFDPTDGISANTFDFIGVAIHEIGHALGFVSGVDFLDVYGGNGPGAGSLGYSLNDTSIYSALDMFRYSADSTRAVRGKPDVLDLSVGSESYFSIDGGKTALFDNKFSTGRYNGDGDQASHWKDAVGCTGQIGILDPTFCFGQAGEVTALDLAAYDAMGWNTSVDVLANPNYVATTASIYRQFASLVPEPGSWALMLTGFAMMGATLRSRRTRTRVTFAA